MNSNKPPARPTSMTISHLGINVCNMDKMEAFYRDILGFTITDRGSTIGLDIVFMSRDSRDHHQIVLSSGRPENLPANTKNPDFGPVINQISFRLNSLKDLRQMYEFLSSAYDGDLMPANHGLSWSIYFDDPEGNKIEVFVDTPWYCRQPVFEPLDFSMSDEDIVKSTEALSRSQVDFKPIENWREEINRKMAG
jgi:catechol-2,3-dioxygenase